MAGTTISGSYTISVTLSTPATQNPATISGTGRINVTATSGSALYGTHAAAWSVYNYGTVIGAARGVSLAAGGTVTNESGGLISGGTRGVDITGAAGIVTNAGSIAGGTQQGVRLVHGGSVTNMAGGKISGAASYAAVYILNGGTVTNQNGGSIDGAVEFDVSAGTITNSGLINTGHSAAFGVDILAGGFVSNVAGGRIEGATAGVFDAGGTIINSGSISGDYAITSNSGGSVTNQTSGILTASSTAIWFQTGQGTIVNAGKISGEAGIFLQAGGSVYNELGATINSRFAMRTDAGGTLTNAGLVIGSTFAVVAKNGAIVSNMSSGVVTGGIGIYLVGTGTAINDGTVVGTAPGGGVEMLDRDLLINHAHATIGGGVYAKGVSTIINYGIIGTSSRGILFFAGGALSNASGAVIQSAVYFATTASTLDNAGSVGGAVQLAEGGRVDNASGAVIGTVSADRLTTIINAGQMGLSKLKNGASITNASGGLISGTGISITGAPALIANYGTFDGDITIGKGGTITNASSGKIVGSVQTLYSIAGAPALSITNAGAIGGISIATGGSVSNAAAGRIIGNLQGIFIRSSDATQAVVNYGVVSGSLGVGFYVFQTIPDTLSLVNGGTITGTGGTAVQFNTGPDSSLIPDLLVVDPGAVFNGDVVGGEGSNTVELAAGTGAAGTLGVFGSDITNFSNIVFDPGSQWTIQGNATGFSGPITGFSLGDTVDLVGLQETVQDYTAGTLTLVGDRTISLDLPGPFATASFNTAPDAGSGTDVFLVPCFVAGTHILTERGEVQVENLRVGDKALTLGGQSQPIIWIGVGQVLATRGRRSAATPVIVRKDALAANVPNRDLHVTKGHALYLEGALIPVECLINNQSIAWDDRAREVTIYHVELATHDVLLANGAPAESYRDDGNRWLFQNANTGWKFAPKEPCARILTSGPAVDAIWRQLRDRAGSRPRVLLTSDPDLHLLVDGVRIDALDRSEERYVFRLASRPRNVRIRSRSAAPVDLGIRWDPRVLGVAIRQILSAQARRQRRFDASSAALAQGYHEYEPVNKVRWTNGDAVVPTEVFAGMSGTSMLTLRLGGSTQYLCDIGGRKAA